MNPQELQELLRELVQGITQVIQSGETLSDEFQGMLAQTLAALLNRIEQAEQIQPLESTQPEVQPAGMPSSNVEGFAYDDKNNRLFVRFLGDYPNRNGPIYSYDKVPPVIFNLFRQGAAAARTNGKNRWGSWWKGKSPSLGASVYTLLKLGRFPYRRVA